MKGYKAFDLNMRCREFQYEIGKEYSMPDDEIEICENGFHFCLNPLDCLNYYDVTESIFCEVESFGKVESLGKKLTDSEDSKVCTSKIRIVRKVDLDDIIMLSIDFMFKNDSNLSASANYSNLAASDDSSKLAASGDRSQLAASGDSSKLAASGDRSNIAASGNYSKLAANGHGSNLAVSGNYSDLAASGNCSYLAASGYSSKLSASGDRSRLVANGDDSHLAANGTDSIICAIGNFSIAKGVKGTWITLAEYDESDVVKLVKTEQIDGNILKENTFYKLENGKFVPAINE